MSDLKPCPFCGESDTKYFTGLDDCYHQCQTCTTTGPNGEGEESATIQWNTRPIEDALRTKLQAANERIERLRKALTHLINKAHAVTRIERHGMRVSLDRIRQLYDAQLKAEEIEKETT